MNVNRTYCRIRLSANVSVFMLYNKARVYNIALTCGSFKKTDVPSRTRVARGGKVCLLQFTLIHVKLPLESIRTKTDVRPRCNFVFYKMQL